MKNNKVNIKKSKANNNGTMVSVFSTTAEAAVMVNNLYNFFNEKDEHEIYLQDTEEIFTKLTNAVQAMIGCEVFWNFISKHVE